MGKVEEAKVAKDKALAAKVKKEADAKQQAADAAKQEYHKTQEKIKAAKCENNPGCSTLVGYCCPTLVGQKLSGVTLGCCGAAGMESLSEAAPNVASSDNFNFTLLVALAAMVVGAAAAWAVAKRSDDVVVGYVAA